jgi:hypothetical protein
MERDGAMGTFFMRKSDEVRSQLWRDNVSFVAASAEEADFAEAARDLEILLDYVGPLLTTLWNFSLTRVWMDPLFDPQSNRLPSEMDCIADLDAIYGSGSCNGQVLLSAILFQC